MNRPLHLSVTFQGEKPHFCSCYLTSLSGRLFPLSQEEARAISELIEEASGRSGAIVAWSSSEDPQFVPAISDSYEVQFENESDADPSASRTYCAFRDGPADFAPLLRLVWNSFGLVRIYPVDNDGEMVNLVASDFWDSRDRDETGIGWQHGWLMRSKSGCLTLIVATLGTVAFALRLILSPKFRRRLIDPFLQVRATGLVERLGAHFWKGGHDEFVGFEFLCANEGIGVFAERIFEDHEISLEVETHRRKEDSQGTAGV